MSGGVVPGRVPAKTRAAHCLSPPITSCIDPPGKHILQPDTQSGRQLGVQARNEKQNGSDGQERKKGRGGWKGIRQWVGQEREEEERGKGELERAKGR